MDLTSPAFADQQSIPRDHSGEGKDLSPPLHWTGAPPGVAEFALLCDDPDAPTPEPWVHWVLYRIPADLVSLPEGVPRLAKSPQLGGALQGCNSWPNDNLGYRGPMPPPGHGVHHYHFRLYALDRTLALPPGAEKAALLQAMQGHILAEARLTGTYERKK